MNFLSVKLWWRSCVPEENKQHVSPQKLGPGAQPVKTDEKVADPRSSSRTALPPTRSPPPSTSTPTPHQTPPGRVWGGSMAVWRLLRRLVCSLFHSAKASLTLLLAAILISVLTHVPLDLSQQTALPFFYKTGVCCFLCDLAYCLLGRLFPRHRTRLALALGCLEFLLALGALDAILNGRRRASFRRLSNACAGDYEYVACAGCYGDERDIHLDLLLVTFFVFYNRRRRWDLVDNEEVSFRERVKSALRTSLRLCLGVLIGVIALPIFLAVLNASFGYRKKMAPGETWTHVTSLARLLLAIDAVGVTLAFVKPRWGGTLSALTSSVEYFALVTWCRHFSSNPVDPRDLSNVISGLARNVTSPEALARYLDPDFASSVLIGSRSGCPAPAGGVARINDQLSLVCSLVDAHNVRSGLLDLIILGVILLRPRALWG